MSDLVDGARLDELLTDFAPEELREVVELFARTGADQLRDIAHAMTRGDHAAPSDGGHAPVVPTRRDYSTASITVILSQ